MMLFTNEIFSITLLPMLAVCRRVMQLYPTLTNVLKQPTQFIYAWLTEYETESQQLTSSSTEAVVTNGELQEQCMQKLR